MTTAKATILVAILLVAVASSVTLTSTTSVTTVSASPDPRSKAADHLVRSKPSLVHSSPRDKLVQRAVAKGARGLHYVSYERTYGELPVLGGDFVVVTDSAGKVLSTSVSQTTPLAVSTKAEVTSVAAAAAATDVAGRHRLVNSGIVSGPRLVVLAEGEGRLVYEVVVSGMRGRRPSRLHVYVDARTGKEVRSWDEVKDGNGQGYYHGTVTFPTTFTRTRRPNKYGTYDSTRPGLRCGRGHASPVIPVMADRQTFTGPDDEWGNGSPTSLETACVDAMYAAQRGWDMLRSWLGRDGFDGNGRGFPLLVGFNDANAFWTGSSTYFGTNEARTRSATATDVINHELGHAIFQWSPGGSGSTLEGAGLNESAGDIFGALAEWYMNEPAALDPPDYLVGEEVDFEGQGPIRNMPDPSLLGDPKCFDPAVPAMEPHSAAGVQNHWFYLLAEGSNANDPAHGKPNSPTCNGDAFGGIGVRQVGMIFMETLNRKTSTWTHQLVRKASLEAAIQLFGCPTYQTVKRAWNAVSVPPHPAEPTC